MRPEIRILETHEVGSIVADAVKTLSEVGVVLEHDECRRLVEGAGAQRRDGRTLIKSKQIFAALDSVPDTIELFDRDGNPAAVLGGGAACFAPGSAAIHFLDPETRRQRGATLEDLAHLAWATQACDHIKAQSTALVPSDVAEELADRVRLAVALSNSSKPIVTGTFLKDGFQVMMDMLLAVRGGAEALKEKPLAIMDCAATSPLMWSDLTSDALIKSARAGIPANIISMPLAGATSPVTLRDALVQHTAENLAGVVISQLAAPGASIIWGCSAVAMDMRFGTTPLGSMETMLLAAGTASVGRSLGLPTHAYLALSDSKCVDWQAGAETSAGALFAVLGMLDLVSGPGMLNFECTQSLEKLVLDNEACALAHRLMRGIGSGYEGSSSDLLSEVVEAGHFLKSRHTRTSFRKELSFPGPLISRDGYDSWIDQGARSAADRAKAEVATIVARGNPAPLPEHTSRELQTILTTDAERLGVPVPHIPF
jgi:trimethylamine:corrinoid methyltransferase-like protein